MTIKKHQPRKRLASKIQFGLEPNYRFKKRREPSESKTKSLPRLKQT